MIFKNLDIIGAARLVVQQWREDKIQALITTLGFVVGLISLVSTLLSAIPSIGSAVSEFFSQVSFVNTAYAATLAKESNSPAGASTAFLNFLFTLGVFIAFFWSFYVSMHHEKPANRQAAKSYANLFVGILIGSAKGSLGLG